MKKWVNKYILFFKPNYREILNIFCDHAENHYKTEYTDIDSFVKQHINIKLYKIAGPEFFLIESSNWYTFKNILAFKNILDRDKLYNEIIQNKYINKKLIDKLQLFMIEHV